MMELGPMGEALAAMAGCEVPAGMVAAMMAAAVEVTPAVLVAVAGTVALMKGVA